VLFTRNSCCSHGIILKLSRYVLKGRVPHRAHELGESLNTLRKCKLSLYLHLLRF
jgi:hypothetical protein